MKNESTGSTTSWIGRLVAVGLGLCSIAPAASAAVWTYEWDAATQTPASAGLTLNGTNPNTPSPTGLVIDSTGYYSGAFDGDSSTGWTIAFSVRRLDTSSDFGAFFAVFDGSEIVRFDFYANAYYRMNSSSGIEYVNAPGGNNQQFVDVQLSLLDATVNVYFNGNDTPVFTYTAPADANPPLFYLGNYSSGTPTSEVGYLKWTNEGAFAPSAIPEPSTVLLVAGGILGAVILRRRKSSR